MVKSSRILAAAGAVAGLGLAVAPLNVFATNGVVSDQHTDKIVLTVMPSCTFGSWQKTTSQYSSGITHDDSSDDYAADGTDSTPYTISATTWNTSSTTDSVDSVSAHTSDVVDSTGYGVLNGESGLNATNNTALANPSSHTVHRSMLAGTETENFATTTLWVVCNNGDGYSVTAAAADLTNGTAGENIAAVAVDGYSTTQSGYNGIVFVEESGDGAVKDANVVDDAEAVIAHKAGVTQEAGDSITIEYGMGVASSQKADTYVGSVVYKLYKGVNGTNDMVIPPAGN